ncbi:MAG TPA: hypothetical protein VMD58_09070 [Acidobacteriaceae bacterium]|nr:hypothetical protein [Acidobacteriaceae bacterium]
MDLGRRGRCLAFALALLMIGVMSPGSLRAQGARDAAAAAQSQSGTKPVQQQKTSEENGAGRKTSRRHQEMVARKPPSPGMVWVNTTSKVYHKPGSRWYGRTREGKWMTEADAQKAGYKAGRN